MIIKLPKRFQYSNKQSKAYVKGKVLYIEGSIRFERLMYELAYSLYGEEQCYYCKRKMKKKTLDHRYPRAYGGVSIPDNLVPCCPICNNAKRQLTEPQFQKLLSIKEQAQSKYINRCLRDNIKRCQNMEFLPKDWVEDYPIDQLLEEIDFSFISPDSMKKITAEYEEYHHYIRPIVVTSNGWPIDGLKTLYHAKIQGINHVQAIVLDNVIKVW